MSKCPFWSTEKKKIECHDECPMLTINQDESCPFNECVPAENIDIKGIVDEDFAYSQDNLYDMNYNEETSNF